MTIGGTLPRRNPGTLICWAIFLYAASRLGLSSSKGTSTVSFALVGVKVSTALFTGGLLGRKSKCLVCVGGRACPSVAACDGAGVLVGATGLEPAISCSQSRRASHYATPRFAPHRPPGSGEGAHGSLREIPPGTVIVRAAGRARQPGGLRAFPAPPDGFPGCLSGRLVERSGPVAPWCRPSAGPLVRRRRARM